MGLDEINRRVRVVHEAVKAVCPIRGIRMPDANDRATWVVLAEPNATPEQIAEGQRVLMAVDLTPKPEPVSDVSILAAKLLEQQKVIDGLLASIAAVQSKNTGG